LFSDLICFWIHDYSPLTHSRITQLRALTDFLYSI
jgi:hypothetical protein